MSFYLTLTNDQSIDNSLEFNYATSFTNYFIPSIFLPIPYEVGLVEIILENFFTIFLGEFKYIYNSREISIPIIAHDNQSLESIVHNLNKQLRYQYFNKFINKEDVAFGYDEIDGLLDEVPKIEIIDNHIIHTHHDNAFFQYSGEIGKYLYCENFIKVTKQTTVDIIQNHLPSLQSSYIISDLLNNQWVGNDRLPLLRNLCVKTTNDLEHIIYDKPFYHKVDKQIIDSINIEIKSDIKESEIVPNRGRIKLVLHFRPL